MWRKPILLHLVRVEFLAFNLLNLKFLCTNSEFAISYVEELNLELEKRNWKNTFKSKNEIGRKTKSSKVPNGIETH